MALDEKSANTLQLARVPSGIKSLLRTSRSKDAQEEFFYQIAINSIEALSREAEALKGLWESGSVPTGVDDQIGLLLKRALETIERAGKRTPEAWVLATGASILSAEIRAFRVFMTFPISLEKGGSGNDLSGLGFKEIPVAEDSDPNPPTMLVGSGILAGNKVMTLDKINLNTGASNGLDLAGDARATFRQIDILVYSNAANELTASIPTKFTIVVPTLYLSGGDITLDAGKTVDGRDVSADGAILDAHLVDGDAHHAESHTVASHSDTTATGAELETLTDGSDAADIHIHDARYFTEAEHLDASAGAGDAGKPVKLDAGGQIDATMINDADVSHDSITDVSADDHHNESHTVASHSDTTATGAELETLTDGSDADALHVHDDLMPLTVVHHTGTPLLITDGKAWWGWHTSTGTRYLGGIMVEADLSADVVLWLAYEVPNPLPAGSARLQFRHCGAMTSGNLVGKWQVYWNMVANAEDIDTPALTGEGTVTLTRAAADTDEVISTFVYLNHTALVAGGLLLAKVVFETASWTIDADTVFTLPILRWSTPS